MNHYVVAFFIIVGSFFTFAAAIGIVRFPGVLLRMHASTKAGTMGAGCLLLAVAIHFGDYGIVTRCLATVLFLFVTAPVSSHAIGRAAYFSGIKMWSGTIVDELRGRYDQKTHTLQHSAKLKAKKPIIKKKNTRGVEF